MGKLAETFLYETRTAEEILAANLAAARKREAMQTAFNTITKEPDLPNIQAHAVAIFEAGQSTKSQITANQTLSPESL